MEFLTLIKKYNRENPKSVLLLIISTLFWSFTFPLSPWLLGSLISQIEKFGDGQHSYQWIILTASALVVVQVLRNFNYYVINKSSSIGISNSQYIAINEIFTSILKQSVGYFKDNDIGSISGKFNNISVALPPLIKSFYIIILPQSLAILLSGLVMSLITPILSIFFWVWAVIICTSTYYHSKKAKIESGYFAKSQTEFNSALTDTLINMDTVQLNVQEEQEKKRIQQLAQQMRDTFYKMSMYLENTRLKKGVITDSYIAATLLTLLWGYKGGFVSVGDFTFVFTVIFNIAGVFYSLGTTIADFHNNLGKLSEGYSLLQTDNKKDEGQKNMTTKIFQNGDIVFDNITFAYQQGPVVLENFNLTIKQNEKVGIVGLSGSGKSTLINLLLGVYKVNTGVITIQGTNIDIIERKSIRENISFVPQTSKLFNRSLRDNLTYGILDVTDESFEKACQQAHCDFIHKLNKQYETIAGEQGNALSGGQRQRVLIARAILKNAPILLFDEATSALDSDTEEKINESIIQLIKDKTAIIIAHRLSTLKKMDRIVVLEAGKIKEEGSHSELLNNKGSSYADLWKLQANKE